MDNSAGILTKKEIFQFLNEKNLQKRLFVSPLLSLKAISDTSIDLRLGHHFLYSKPSIFSEIDVYDLRNFNDDPIDKNLFNSSFGDTRLPIGNYFCLHPRKSVQVGTLEYLGIPGNLEGVITLRASFSALNISANTAQVHPGHKGIISLTITNNSDQSIKLYPGIRIFNLRLNTLCSELTENTTSRYHGKMWPEPSELYFDDDIPILGPTIDPVIIGVVHSIGAGRSTAINYLEKTRGFKKFSLASILRADVSKNGGSLTKENLQKKGNEYRSTFGDDILAKKLRNSHEWLQCKSSLVIVDGFKNSAEVKEFKKQRKFFSLGIDADFDVRWKRVKKRNRSTDPTNLGDFRKLNSIDQGHEKTLHGQNTKDLISKADNIICNNGTETEFYQKIDEWLRQILYLD